LGMHMTDIYVATLPFHRLQTEEHDYKTY
jgi:hypothetical protein